VRGLILEAREVAEEAEKSARSAAAGHSCNDGIAAEEGIGADLLDVANSGHRRPDSSIENGARHQHKNPSILTFCICS
jgi:hypothetical protein